jgi:hypothetical protein
MMSSYPRSIKYVPFQYTANQEILFYRSDPIVIAVRLISKVAHI